jgi:predicted nucleic acid-binding protein
MRLLLDTNIIVRFSNLDDVQSPLVRSAIAKLLIRGDDLFLVPQSLYEFWSVTSRPSTGNSNGIGWTTPEVRAELDKLQEQFLLIPDTPEVFDRWLELVTRHEVSGRPSHDARLAAAMQVHGLDTLLTLNAPDFKRYGLNVLSPADL